MLETEYTAWLAEIIPAYADDKVQSGQWTLDESVERSAKEFAADLPLGLRTPDHYLYTVQDESGAAVGVLWFSAQTKAGARIAYVYDVAIQPSRQREGHAYRAFLALETEVRKLGLSGVALHVFGHNKSAQGLYAKLGFEVTNINLFKAVAAAGS